MVKQALVYSIEVYGSHEFSQGEGWCSAGKLSGHDFTWHQLLD